MKTLSKIMIFTGGILLAGAPALRADQPATTPAPAPADNDRPRMKQMRENRMKLLDEKLHLTDEQKAKIQEIWNKGAQQGRELRKEQAMSRAEMRGKRREMFRAMHQQVRDVLTADQQKTFDELRPAAPHPAPQAGDAEGR